MLMPKINHQEIWIIGYGNSQRGDDGIGPYIVKKLKKQMIHYEQIRFRSIRQLTPDLIHDLRCADVVIFIDATVEVFHKGWQLFKVKPDLECLPFLSHHFSPAFLMGLFRSVYQRCPKVWMVSVQGYDFDLEEGFYPETKRNIEKAIYFIYGFVDRMINNKKNHEDEKNRRMQWAMEQIF